MKCLVVIAHPDDETIWMGGTITRYAPWEWHVVCLTRGDDPDRAPRFAEAARELGARLCISNLDDSPALLPLSPNLAEIKSRVLRCFVDALCPEPNVVSGTPCPETNPLDFDLIFTHGPNGEYGHKRHEQAHRAVREMIESGDLRGNPIFFAYDGCNGRRPHPAEDVMHTIALTPGEFARKQHIIRDIYGFQPGSFEFDSAGPIEAFSSPDPAVFQHPTPKTQHPIGGR